MSRKKKKRLNKLLRDIRRAELDLACYEIPLFKEEYDMLVNRLKNEFGIYFQ